MKISNTLLALDEEESEPRTEQIGVQSVEVAARLLKTMASFDGPQTLGALASAAGMQPAKVHRYLVSLIREGFVEQNASDGRYDFGGAARRIGRVAVNRTDIMRIGSPLLRELRDDVQETTAMGMWTPQGPMIVEWFDMIRPVSVIVRPGSILPMLSSAMGLIYSSYLPSKVTRPLIEMQSANAQPSPDTSESRFERICRKGFSAIHGDLVKGLDAAAVPVLDHRSEIIASLAVIGATGDLDTTSSGRPVRALKAAAQRFSSLLG